MKLISLALIFALEAAANPPVAAPAAKPSLDISSHVDRSEITIGDRIAYEIKVVYPGKGRVELPSVLGNLGAFEVKDYGSSEPKDAGTLRIQTWRFALSTFTVGRYMIPPQQVLYVEEKGKAADTAVFMTQPIEINVARTSPETVKDIADIAPPIDLKARPDWLVYGSAAGALLAIAALLLLLLRRRKSADAPGKPALPPYEEAMEHLAGINAAALVRQNRARELCFALSEVLRRYVTRRYGVDAIDMTTSEFLAARGALPVTAAQKDWIGIFCETTDLVKFAGAPLLESEAETLVGRLKAFLEQTRPREAAAEGGEAKAGAPAKAAGGKPP